jgi:2'-hydroxyisoflavone reductase
VRVLVLGGSTFVSRAVAREYLSRGHRVSCVTRRLDSSLPEGATRVVADRHFGRDAYEGVLGEWDEVVDVATEPAFVRDALRAVGATARHWSYVSSCSVYRDQDQPGADESRETVEPLPEGEVSSPDTYGAAKSAAEQSCRDALEDRLQVVRPGLIVGPGDLSDRGGYWPMRFARDVETVLVPAARGLFAQVIDVADPARWMADCGESRVVGTMNAVGDSVPLSRVLTTIRDVVGHRGDVTVADDGWLVAQGVAPWAGPDSLPLWIPLGQGFDGFARRSHDRARRLGLTLRPLEDTVREILIDERTLGPSRPRRAGLTPRRERELIDALAAGG